MTILDLIFGAVGGLLLLILILAALYLALMVREAWKERS